MRWAALWLGLLTACGLQAGVDWHLVFCLPYNNDLAEHSAFIQAELGRLHTDDRVAITLLVDTPEEPVTFLHYPGGTAPSTDTTRWHSCQSGRRLLRFWSGDKHVSHGPNAGPFSNWDTAAGSTACCWTNIPITRG